MEKHLHSTLRKAKLIGSHLRQSMKGYIVKVFNRKKGNKILDRANKAFANRFDAEEKIQNNNIKKIHKKYNAREPIHNEVPAPRRSSTSSQAKH